MRSYKYKGKTYYEPSVSYTDSQGFRHFDRTRFCQNDKRFTSKRDASLFEAEMRLNLKSKIEKDYSSLSFKEYHQKFLTEARLDYRKNTLMQYDGNLMKWMTDSFYLKRLDHINKSDIHMLIHEEMPKLGATPHTRKRSLKCLRKIFETAVDNGFVKMNPARGIKVKTPPPARSVLNAREADLFLSQAKESNHSYYYLWSLALFTGMRTGELYALRWCNIDEESRSIYVNSSWSYKEGLGSTKSNKDRVIPISSSTQKVLSELKLIESFSYIVKDTKGNDLQIDDFVLPRITSWNNGAQSGVTKKFSEQIGITPVTFHQLRATFLTNLLSQGVSIPHVMAISGHSKISTLNEYIRLAGIEITGVMDKLSYGV